MRVVVGNGGQVREGLGQTAHLQLAHRAQIQRLAAPGIVRQVLAEEPSSFSQIALRLVELLGLGEQIFDGSRALHFF